MSRVDIDCGERPEPGPEPEPETLGLARLPKFRAALAAWMTVWEGEGARDTPNGPASAEIYCTGAPGREMVVVTLRASDTLYTMTAWRAGLIEHYESAELIAAKVLGDLEEARLRLFFDVYRSML